MRTRVAVVAVVVMGAALTACAGADESDGLNPPQREFVTDAGAIDARLSSDRAGVLKLGSTICTDLAKGRPVAEIVDQTRRFTGGEGVIDAAQAGRLVIAAQQHLCR